MEEDEEEGEDGGDDSGGVYGGLSPFALAPPPREPFHLGGLDFTLKPCIPLFMKDFHLLYHVKEILPKILLIL